MSKQSILLGIMIFLGSFIYCPGQSNDSMESGERIRFVTDRPLYIVGETVWISLWMVADDSRIPDELSTVVTIDIIDNSGNLISKERALLERAHGKAQFQLKSDIITGEYAIIAYSNRQLNQVNKNIQSKKITIVNPVIPPQNSNSAISSEARAQGDHELPSSDMKAKLVHDNSLGNREMVEISTEEIKQRYGNQFPFAISVYKWADTLEIEQIDRSIDAQIEEFSPVETRAPIIQGRIIGDRLEPQLIYLSTPGEGSYLNCVVPDADGQFSFELSPLLSSTDIYFIAEPPLSENQQIQLQSSSPRIQMTSQKSPTLKLANKAYIEQLIENIQIEQIYNSTNFANGKMRSTPKGNLNQFYGVPDRKYVLSNYSQFESVRDVIREYVQEVVLRKKKGILGLYLKRENYSTPANVFIDGLPVEHIESILELRPDQVESIEILKSNYSLFARDYSSGIVNFITFNPPLNNGNIKLSAIKQAYLPLQQNLNFSSPDYNRNKQKSSTTPDFRNTLYWNPEVDTSDVLTFFTGDDVGSYRVELTCIDRDGAFLRFYDYFTVQ